VTSHNTFAASPMLTHSFTSTLFKRQVLTAPKDAQGREITWRSAAALDGYIRRLSEVWVGGVGWWGPGVDGWRCLSG